MVGPATSATRPQDTSPTRHGHTSHIRVAGGNTWTAATKRMRSEPGASSRSAGTWRPLTSAACTRAAWGAHGGMGGRVIRSKRDPDHGTWQHTLMAEDESGVSVVIATVGPQHQPGITAKARRRRLLLLRRD